MTKEFDFNSFIDHENMESLEWDVHERRGYPETVLPMWAADTNHRMTPAVARTFHERIAHGIFGYASPGASYFETVASWQFRRFGWEVDPVSIVAAGGVIPALTYAARAFTEPGNGVITKEPVYYPLRSIAENSGRAAVSALLMHNEQRQYVYDFTILEAAFVASGARAIILYNPRDPADRVQTREELLGLAGLVTRLDILVLVDEIHANLTHSGIRTTPFSSLPGMSDRTVTFTSPLRSFNLAGLQLASIVVPDRKWRQGFIRESNVAGCSRPSTLGPATYRTAYNEGEEWFDAFRGHMVENLEFLAAMLEEIDGIELAEPEGTYLPQLDCRKLIHNLGIEANELDELMVNEADLRLDDDATFGDEGLGYTRVNIACPRNMPKETVNRLRRTVETQSMSNKPTSALVTATSETASIDSEASTGPKAPDDPGAAANSTSPTNAETPDDPQEASQTRQGEDAERAERDS